jgi:beta-lactamase regulating signal transducer with metallopeptidase domain
MTPWTFVIGWTLVHFLWQGSLIAVVAATVLRLVRRHSSTLRYLMACAALAAMVGAPVITIRMLASAPSLTSARPGTDSSARRLTNPLFKPLAQLESVTLSRGRDDARMIRPRIDAVLSTVVLVWMIGVTVLLLRMVGGWWRVHRLQLVSRALLPSRWQITGEQIACRIGLKRAFHIVEVALVNTPCVVGWVRPVVVLPIAALVNLTPAQVEGILAHELAHIRRHDYLVNLLQALAETFLFYHPGVWWVSTRIRAEREHCCDDVAVECCGDAEQYVRALVEIETWRAQDATLALAVTGGSLLERVRRILRVPTTEDRLSTPWALMLVVSVAAIAGARAQGLRLVAATTAPTENTARVQIRSAAPREPNAPVQRFVSGDLTSVQTSPPQDAAAPWLMDETAHIQIYFHANTTNRVPQIARDAERAYTQISADLQHDLPAKVPVVLFLTQREQGAVLPGPLGRDHVLLSLDVPAARLTGTIVHELTHVFAFDMLPPSSTRNVPPWVHEGLAEYERGTWDPADVTQLRNLVATGAMAKLSQYDAGRNRATYSVLHAGFDFIETRYGKAGIRDLLLALRNLSTNVFEDAFHLTQEEFDRAFEEYLQQWVASRK